MRMVVFDTNAELSLGCGGRLSAEVDDSTIIDIGYMKRMLSQDSHEELVIYGLIERTSGIRCTSLHIGCLSYTYSTWLLKVKDV